MPGRDFPNYYYRTACISYSYKKSTSVDSFFFFKIIFKLFSMKVDVFFNNFNIFILKKLKKFI
jgi:hypothetical protein